MQPFGLGEAVFLDVALEGITWGIYTSVFLIYMRLDRQKKKNILYYPLISLWIICTAFFAVDAGAAWFAIFGTTDSDTAASSNLNVASSVMYSLIDYISQLILIYRCWIMWGQKWPVVVLPLLSSLAAFVGGLVVSVDLAVVGRNGIAASWSLPLGTASFALSLVTNTLVTATLVLRLWGIYREIKAVMPSLSSQTHDLRPTISMLVESGALTFIGQLIWVVLFGLQNPGLNTVGGPITQFYGINPTIIIIRVAKGSSYETTRTRMEGTMRFNPGGSSHATSITVTQNRTQGYPNSMTKGKLSSTGSDIEIGPL